MPTQFESIWAYKVKLEYLPIFKKMYGANGKWVKLFKQCPGFISSELKQDLSTPGQYITVDTWRSQHDYLAMKKHHQQSYALLDKMGDAYLDSEQHLGYFTNLSTTRLAATPKP